MAKAKDTKDKPAKAKKEKKGIKHVSKNQRRKRLMQRHDHAG